MAVSYSKRDGVVVVVVIDGCIIGIGTVLKIGPTDVCQRMALGASRVGVLLEEALLPKSKVPSSVSISFCEDSWRSCGFLCVVGHVSFDS